ncbi:MAG TPA: PD-(D/E)XK nuclease family protein, partial [Thermoanaerobaculaceae bacterium]|nr:PD-(D/E)XK nuclease family protein [Thermoanaerobaculaceae bacterium]
AAPEAVPERPALAIGELAARSERLAALRPRAAERMRRPFSAAASEEAHRLLDEAALEAAFGDGAGEEVAAARRAREAAREAAADAGTAVHRALEALELDGDLAAALARQRALLPAYLDALSASGTRDAALARAARVLDGFAASALFERLSEIAPHVVAREVAVLLPPDGAAEAPVGFVSGAIDLVYRDPRTGDLVVADYKTDEVASDAEIAARAGAYAAQGAVYVRALREALGLPAPPRFELWFLAAARIVTPL